MPNKATKVARMLRQVLSPSVLDELGREAGQSERMRVVTPSRLVMALIGALSGGSCESIADVLREFNRQQRTTTRYKAFYNRLARPSFPLFLRALLCRVLGVLTMRTLEPVADGPLSAFTDNFSGHEADGAPLRGGNSSHLAFAFEPASRRLLVLAPHLFRATFTDGAGVRSSAYAGRRARWLP